MPKFTAEDIMRRCLDRISNDLDKREGSVIWDALMPACLELEALWIEAERLFNNAFADTADEESLLRLGRERGIVPLKRTKAVVKGKFNKEISKGVRFKSGGLFFVTLSRAEVEGEFFYAFLECESFGTQGNFTGGELVPVRAISGLVVSEIVDIVRPARNDESVEEFRARYFEEVKRKDYGGNIEDYIRWCKDIRGVGGCYVIPVWNGGGSVKVVITGSDYKGASKDLIDLVQTAIDPVKNHGEGIGLAPIGHTVTVVSADVVAINVGIRFILKSNHNWDSVKPAVSEILERYISSERAKFGKEEIVIRGSSIISILMQSGMFIEIQDLTLNDSDERVVLDRVAVPILGEVKSLS